MNVTAFSLKFCQHDIVPWCNLSKHLDLIWALLHNSLQEGLGSNSANSSANEKSYPLLLTDLDIQQRSQSTEQHPHPGKITWKWWPFPNFTWPQRQCLISPDGQQEKNQGTCWKPSCCFWAWIFQVNTFQFFPPKERRENLTLPHSVLSQAPAR